MNVLLHGRRSSHFTRVPRLFCAELGIDLPLAPILDVKSTDAANYGGNPAYKLPTLIIDGEGIYGAENICRTVVERAKPKGVVVWPESVPSALLRNANELVWHSMSAQVQWVFGTVVCGLPSDSVYFQKGRAGLDGALGWLEQHVDAALSELPAARTVSLLEVTLLCLLEHLEFRGTTALTPWPRLHAFQQKYSEREAAKATRYRFDT